MTNFNGSEEVWLRGSSITGTASFTPAASSHGAGTLIGAAREVVFTDIRGDTIRSGSLIRILTSVIRIGETSVPSGQTSFTGHMYSVTPPSAQADTDTWTLAAGDLNSYLGSLSLGTPVDLGGGLYIKTGYLDTDVKLTGNSLFLQLITAGSHTPAAVARQVTLLGIQL